MKAFYDKGDYYRKTDQTINYLGYWTDGGAYYYYDTEPGKNYEQTILDVKTYADSLSLPYRYVQYDSWFYAKDSHGAVTTWTPTPDIAPDGFQTRSAGNVGSKGQVWTTYSRIGKDYVFGIILAADMTDDFSITPSDAGFAPVVLYGEENKFVPMSRDRVGNMAVFSNDLQLLLYGSPGESTVFTFFLDGKINPSTEKLPLLFKSERQAQKSDVQPPFQLVMDKNGGYSLQQGTRTWLQGAPTFLYTDGKRFSTEDSSLRLVETEPESGIDKIGRWNSTCFRYSAGDVSFRTCVKTWANELISLPAVLFQQVFSQWGEMMRYYYDKDDIYRKTDVTLNYLGYWTDGGAYYFYQTEPNKTYEQTILDVYNYSLSLNLPYRTWLLQMGEAARATGLTIQYCMSNPRHAMQSLEIPVVTQARVSGDYRGGSDQWQIGKVSVFADAIGIAPFKDNFWSEELQPDNHYNLTEPHSELQAAVATLSTGPVAPADMIGHTNASMLMQCCNAGGLVLRPNKPATAIDKQFMEVWTTFSQIGETAVFGIILAAAMDNSYSLTPTDAGFQLGDIIDGEIEKKIFVDGASNAGGSVSVDRVLSGFPSFQVPISEAGLAYVSYQGLMFGGTDIRVASLVSNRVVSCRVFMSASRSQDEDSRVNWGVMGGVEVVPKQFQYDTIVFYGDQGINQVFSEWGQLMRFYYDKADDYRDSDMTLNYLGYWTDGGAYYYYNTEPHKNYEQTILDVKNYTDSVNIPYRSSQTPYAKDNGGPYNFIVEKEKAIPQDLDWLNREFADMNATLSTVDVARTWLLQMGEAARATGLTIQYCMSNPRHAMQSLEIPVVTQARVSGDYRAGSDQWQIGEASIFADAMGIAPFKDTFWTIKVQPGNTYKREEPNGELQAMVSTLSMGPVGPSDMIGHTNVSMLMQCCRADGLVLRPSKPATAIDKQFWQKAWGGNIGPDGEVWTTYSQIGDRWTFGIILAADLRNTFNITPTDAGEDQPIFLTNWNCNRNPFCVYYTGPVFRIGNDNIVLYGEEYKFVPMSRGRVANLDVQSDVIMMTLLVKRLIAQIEPEDMQTALMLFKAFPKHWNTFIQIAEFCVMGDQEPKSYGNVSEIFRLDVEIVQSFLDRIQANMNKARERQDGFTLEESLFALSRFSSNHFNRRLIVAKGALEMLVFILTTDLVEERELAITAVLELAKDPVNAKFFQRDSQLARVLKDLQRCKHEMTRDKASAALTLIQQQPVDETEDEAESALLEEMMADSSNALDILGVTEVEYLLEQLSVTESTVKRLRGDFAPEQVLRVLANLARGDNRKLEILARGGLDVLQQHLLRGDDDVKLQTVDVLLQLASSTENCAILQSHRGLAEAVKSLRRSDNMAMSRAADTLEHAIKDEKAAKASVVSFNHS
nr:hypothetical protein BaRGS_017061 [Batillaria attramentaria]